MKVKTKEDTRRRLHDRIRKKIHGTPARPRLAVFRSQAHIYAQVIDDDGGTTAPLRPSTRTCKGKLKTGGTVAAAQEVGKLIAERAKGRESGGRLRPGRVPLSRADQGLADAAREGGLKF